MKTRESKNYTLYLSVKTMDKLDAFCKRNSISKSAFIQQIIDDSLEGIESLFSNDDLDMKNSSAGLVFLNAFKSMSEQISKLAELQNEFLERQKNGSFKK